MKKLALFLSLLLMVGTASAGIRGKNPVLSSFPVSELGGRGAPARQGVRVVVTDGQTVNDCSSGGGAVSVTCEYNGSSWVASTPGISIWLGTNGESIDNATDGQFTFNRNDSGAVTLAPLDDANPTNIILDSGTTGTITLGSADTTNVLVDSDAGLTFSENSESIVNSADFTFDFTANAAGTVIITASDDDATAALTVDPGGAAALTLGSADVTTVSIDTEGLDVDIDGNNGNTISLENSTTGSVVLDMRDYADTTDDDMAHVALATNCTTATTGAEDCDLTVNATEAGVAATRMLIDGDGHTVFAPEPADGGNGNLQHKIVGIPKIAGFSVGTGNNGANTINVDFGDSETPDTDWTQTANITTSDDSSIFRKGTASLKMVVGATPADGNGADNALGTGDQDWSADESFGLWHRCDTTYSAGDWVLEITDSVAGATEVNFPAYSTADTWVWTEIDISGVADASKDVITDLAIDLSAAGATTFAAGGNCWFDYMWKWDAAEELALTADIYEDGILAMYSVITAGAAITPILEVEGTDFFVHYESGNDFIIPITDLSADSLWGTAALE